MNNNTWSPIGIYNEFLESTKQRKSDKSNYWRGSDMGACARKRYYLRDGVEKVEKLTAREMRVFEIGNMYHYSYQKLIRQIGLEVASEIEIKNEEFGFSGHCDLVAGGIPKEIDEKHFTYYSEKDKEYKLNKKIFDYCLQKRQQLIQEFPNGLDEIMFEFKSQHSQSFSYLTRRPQREHVLQLGSYMLFYDNGRIKNGRIIYISKDDGRTAEFNIQMTSELEKEIKDQLSYLNEQWKKQELPPQLEEIEGKSVNWRCKWCPYMTHCRGENWLKEAMKKVGAKKVIRI